MRNSTHTRVAQTSNFLHDIQGAKLAAWAALAVAEQPHLERQEKRFPSSECADQAASGEPNEIRTMRTERADAIRWIQAQMDDYGLTLEDLDAADCFEPPPVVCYRNAEGQTWDGQGEMPSWLKRAVNAGQSVEFYSVG